MIIDAATVPDRHWIEADLCIVGAGPAGLALAAEFNGKQQRVYVLESGGVHPDMSSRDLSDGESVGHPYFPLAEARARALGGSSYIWEEWMRARPLDPIDFEARPWIAHSGWPIDYADLEPFYRRAHEMLALGPFDYEVAQWSSEEELPTIEGGGQVEPVLFRFSNSADFTATRRELEASANICLVLNATVLELVSDTWMRRVDHMVASAGSPQRFRVNARSYILAAGGLENPRLLLLSRGGSPRGLANEHDQVCRFFMEHPTVRRGHLVPEPESNLLLVKAFSQRRVGVSTVRVAFAPTREAMEREGILNGMALLAPTSAIRVCEAYRSLALLRSAGRKREAPRESTFQHLLALLCHPAETLYVIRAMSQRHYGPQVYRLSMTVEQAPNPESRVTLGHRGTVPASPWLDSSGESGTWSEGP